MIMMREEKRKKQEKNFHFLLEKRKWSKENQY